MSRSGFPHRVSCTRHLRARSPRVCGDGDVVEEDAALLSTPDTDNVIAEVVHPASGRALYLIHLYQCGPFGAARCAGLERPRRNSARRRRCSGRHRAWCRIRYRTSSPPRPRPHTQDTPSPRLPRRIAEQHPRQALREGAPRRPALRARHGSDLSSPAGSRACNRDDAPPPRAPLACPSDLPQRGP